MSEESTTTYAVSEEEMQALANADGILADLAVAALQSGDKDAFDRLGQVGFALFQLEHDLVESGNAERVMRRSDVPDTDED